MIFIGHDLAVIQHISDRVIVLYRGSIMEILPGEDLIHRGGASSYLQASFVNFREWQEDRRIKPCG